MPIVYVVDDFQNVVSAVLRELRGIDAELLGFTESVEALAAVEAKPPDVLVTDLLMSGLNGLELAEQIRARRPSVATIVMSTTQPESLHAIADVPGVVGNVHKPWEPGSIAALVREALVRIG